MDFDPADWSLADLFEAVADGVRGAAAALSERLDMQRDEFEEDDDE